MDDVELVSKYGVSDSVDDSPGVESGGVLKELLVAAGVGAALLGPVAGNVVLLVLDDKLVTAEPPAVTVLPTAAGSVWRARRALAMRISHPNSDYRDSEGQELGSETESWRSRDGNRS